MRKGEIFASWCVTPVAAVARFTSNRTAAPYAGNERVARVWRVVVLKLPVLYLVDWNGL